MLHWHWTLYLYVCVYVCVCICVYIYIYIYQMSFQSSSVRTRLMVISICFVFNRQQSYQSGRQKSSKLSKPQSSKYTRSPWWKVTFDLNAVIQCLCLHLLCFKWSCLHLVFTCISNVCPVTICDRISSGGFLISWLHQSFTGASQ